MRRPAVLGRGGREGSGECALVDGLCCSCAQTTRRASEQQPCRGALPPTTRQAKVASLRARDPGAPRGAASAAVGTARERERRNDEPNAVANSLNTLGRAAPAPWPRGESRTRASLGGSPGGEGARPKGGAWLRANDECKQAMCQPNRRVELQSRDNAQQRRKHKQTPAIRALKRRNARRAAVQGPDAWGRWMVSSSRGARTLAALPVARVERTAPSHKTVASGRAGCRCNQHSGDWRALSPGVCRSSLHWHSCEGRATGSTSSRC